MQTHDYFTRMIALNAAGPNLTRVADDVQEVFVCGSCNEAHDDEDSARECCPVRVLFRFRCNTCRAEHREEGEAKGCCSSISTLEPMQCPVCLRDADSFEIAADCCLHTHPTMTAFGRSRVAELVKAGMPWTAAIASEQAH